MFTGWGGSWGKPKNSPISVTIRLCVHSFNNYFLNSYYVLGTAYNCWLFKKMHYFYNKKDKKYYVRKAMVFSIYILQVFLLLCHQQNFH